MGKLFIALESSGFHYSYLSDTPFYSSNSSDVFPPVCFLFDGTLICALVFRNYFI